MNTLCVTFKPTIMAAIVKNIPVPTVTPPVVLGINTGKKAASATSHMYKNFSTATSKKWYRQTSEKRINMDWDVNKTELEFE